MALNFLSLLKSEIAAVKVVFFLKIHHQKFIHFSAQPSQLLFSSCDVRCGYPGGYIWQPLGPCGCDVEAIHENLSQFLHRGARTVRSLPVLIHHAR